MRKISDNICGENSDIFPVKYMLPKKLSLWRTYEECGKARHVL